LLDFCKKDSGKKRFEENEAAEAQAGTIRREIKRQGLPGDISVTVEGDRVKIAQRFDGDMKRHPEIFEANRPMLEDPDEIYPGQVLRIPNAAKAAA